MALHVSARAWLWSAAPTLGDPGDQVPLRTTPAPTGPRTELSARRAADGREELTTAEDWLTLNAQAERAEDPHRQITDDADLTDAAAAERDDAERAAGPHPDAAETAVPDTVSEVAAVEPKSNAAEADRVPSTAETAEGVEHARRALAEMEQRKAAEERQAEHETRAEQVARWHADEQADVAEWQHAAELAESGPVLELASPLD